jgi:hypothetical protein
MDSRDIRSQLNKLVRLTFRDGEVVEAVLLGADPERDKDLTYEVRRIVSQPPGKREHLEVGATFVGALKDLERWDSL